MTHKKDKRYFDLAQKVISTMPPDFCITYKDEYHHIRNSLIRMLKAELEDYSCLEGL